MVFAHTRRRRLTMDELLTPEEAIKELEEDIQHPTAFFMPKLQQAEKMGIEALKALKHKSRPERKAIDKLLRQFARQTSAIRETSILPIYNSYPCTDQSLALIPDEEELKKEERERIISKLRGVYNQAEDLGALESELREFIEEIEGGL